MKNLYDEATVIESTDALRALYGEPDPRSLMKELTSISPDYRSFIEAASFALIASVGPEGVDISPRGDGPGFVRVHDDTTLLVPDRKGNNRADTLMNIVRDGRLSLLFMIPSVGETLRVIGRGILVADKNLCEQFVMQGKPARSVLVVKVEQVYFQCQKALARSGLWKTDQWPKARPVPTSGQILQNIDASFDGESYDAAYPERIKKTLY